MLKILTARYGPRWARRGIYQRPVSSIRIHLMLKSHYVLNHSLGWRWAFLLQMPVFLLSLLMTGINLRYVTPVRKIAIYFDELKFRMLQGKSKSTKEVLKRIDYWGSLTLLLSVSNMRISTSRTNPHLSQVLSFLIFLSTRFSEEYPVCIFTTQIGTPH